MGGSEICRLDLNNPECSGCRGKAKAMFAARAFGERAPCVRQANAPAIIAASDSQASVSVVIAGRNYAQYLSEAIESALGQTVRPEVIYSDDGSTDESVSVAQRYPIRVVANPHRGVAVARNAGLAEVLTEHVLFLDADDVLPPRYLATKLSSLQTSGVDFVYSPAKCFGDLDRLYEAPDWNVPRLWAANYVNTSALYRARDLRSLGGWRDVPINTCWDWDLAFRMVLAGKRGAVERSETLGYRRHSDSWSFSRRPKDGLLVNYLFRTMLARLAIVCIHGGRLNIMERWLDAVAASVDAWREHVYSVAPAPEHLAATFQLPELRILTTVNDRGLWRLLDRYAGHFRAVSLLCESWDMSHMDEQERKHKVCTKLADGYNRIVEAAPAEAVWSVEDDVIVPPNALTDLTEALWRHHPSRFAVGGPYRSRREHGRMLATDWNRPPDRHTIKWRREGLDKDLWCDMTGTGCLLWDRVMAPHRFTGYCHGVPAHDWAWCLGLRDSPIAVDGMRRQVYLVASAACRHYTSETEWV